jgi:hypothetical protein
MKIQMVREDLSRDENNVQPSFPIPQGIDPSIINGMEEGLTLEPQRKKTLTR